MKTRYQFADRKEAEAAYCKASSETLLSNMCITDLLYGHVEWFDGGDYRLGVCRPTSADGGHVIVTYCPDGQKPSSSVHYLDEYADSIRQQRISHHFGNDTELVGLYDLVVEAQSYARERQRVEWAA